MTRWLVCLVCLALPLALQAGEVSYNCSGTATGRCDHHVPALSKPWFHLLLSALLVLTLFACAVNLFVVVVVGKQKHLHTTRHMLMASMSVTGLLQSAVCLPLSLLDSLSQFWFLGRGVCELKMTLDLLCVTALVFHLISLALERYLTSRTPFPRPTPHRVEIYITGVYLWSVTVALPSMLFSAPKNDPDLDGICIFVKEYYTTLSAACQAFWIPAVLLTVLCLATGYNLSKQMVTIGPLASQAIPDINPRRLSTLHPDDLGCKGYTVAQTVFQLEDIEEEDEDVEDEEEEQEGEEEEDGVEDGEAEERDGKLLKRRTTLEPLEKAEGRAGGDSQGQEEQRAQPEASPQLEVSGKNFNQSARVKARLRWLGLVHAYRNEGRDPADPEGKGQLEEGDEGEDNPFGEVTGSQGHNPISSPWDQLAETTGREGGREDEEEEEEDQDEEIPGEPEEGDPVQNFQDGSGESARHESNLNSLGTLPTSPVGRMRAVQSWLESTNFVLGDRKVREQMRLTVRARDKSRRMQGLRERLLKKNLKTKIIFGSVVGHPARPQHGNQADLTPRGVSRRETSNMLRRLDRQQGSGKDRRCGGEVAASSSSSCCSPAYRGATEKSTVLMVRAASDVDVTRDGDAADAAKANLLCGRTSFCSERQPGSRGVDTGGYSPGNNDDDDDNEPSTSSSSPQGHHARGDVGTSPSPEDPGMDPEDPDPPPSRAPETVVVMETRRGGTITVLQRHPPEHTGVPDSQGWGPYAHQGVYLGGHLNSLEGMSSHLGGPSCRQAWGPMVLGGGLYAGEGRRAHGVNLYTDDPYSREVGLIHPTESFVNGAGARRGERRGSEAGEAAEAREAGESRGRGAGRGGGAGEEGYEYPCTSLQALTASLGHPASPADQGFSAELEVEDEDDEERNEDEFTWMESMDNTIQGLRGLRQGYPQHGGAHMSDAGCHMYRWPCDPECGTSISYTVECPVGETCVCDDCEAGRSCPGSIADVLSSINNNARDLALSSPGLDPSRQRGPTEGEPEKTQPAQDAGQDWHGAREGSPDKAERTSGAVETSGEASEKKDWTAGSRVDGSKEGDDPAGGDSKHTPIVVKAFEDASRDDDSEGEDCGEPTHAKDAKDARPDKPLHGLRRTQPLTSIVSTIRTLVAAIRVPGLHRSSEDAVFRKLGVQVLEQAGSDSNLQPTTDIPGTPQRENSDDRTASDDDENENEKERHTDEADPKGEAESRDREDSFGPEETRGDEDRPDLVVEDLTEDGGEEDGGEEGRSAAEHHLQLEMDSAQPECPAYLTGPALGLQPPACRPRLSIPPYSYPYPSPSALPRPSPAPGRLSPAAIAMMLPRSAAPRLRLPRHRRGPLPPSPLAGRVMSSHTDSRLNLPETALLEVLPHACLPEGEGLHRLPAHAAWPPRWSLEDERAANRVLFPLRPAWKDTGSHSAMDYSYSSMTSSESSGVFEVSLVEELTSGDSEGQGCIVEGGHFDERAEGRRSLQPRKKKQRLEAEVDPASHFTRSSRSFDFISCSQDCQPPSQQGSSENCAADQGSDAEASDRLTESEDNSDSLEDLRDRNLSSLRGELTAMSPSLRNGAASGTTPNHVTRRDRHLAAAVWPRENSMAAVVFMSLAFFACWLPYFLVVTTYAACPDCGLALVPMNSLVWLGYIFSAAFPVIYVILTPPLSRVLARGCCRRRKCCKAPRRMSLRSRASRRSAGNGIMVAELSDMKGASKASRKKECELEV